MLNHAANAGGSKLDPRKIKFPYTVACGNVRLTIRPYRATKAGRQYVSYVFHYRNAQGHRETITRADFEEAVKKARQIAAAADSARLDGLTLHNEDKRAYLQVVESLKPLGVRLEIAVGRGLSGGQAV